jgi:hypothetical protein
MATQVGKVYTGLFDIHVQVKEENVKEKKLTWYYFIVIEADTIMAQMVVKDIFTQMVV